MSQSTDTPADEGRPWHGNPDAWEAVYQWMKTELAKAHARIDELIGRMDAPPAPTQPKDPADAPTEQEPPPPQG